jgi:hypothetical protein
MTSSISLLGVNNTSNHFLGLSGVLTRSMIIFMTILKQLVGISLRTSRWYFEITKRAMDHMEESGGISTLMLLHRALPRVLKVEFGLVRYIIACA